MEEVSPQNLEENNKVLEDLNKKKSHKLLITPIIVLVTILVIGVTVGIFYWLQQKENSGNTKTEKISTNQKNQGSQGTKVGIGETTIKVLPGKSNFLLADGETRIQFGHGGRTDSVPDVIFGDNYSLNDIHNINYLPIKKEIKFYNQGYTFTINNLGCNTEVRFTDVKEVWVTDCTIKVNSQQTESSKVENQKISKNITVNSDYNQYINDFNGVFIKVSSDKLSESHWMGARTGNIPYDIQLITSFGINTIRFTTEELWSKESKQLSIGPLNFSATSKGLDCNTVTIANGRSYEKCNDIKIDLMIKGEINAKTPIKIINYIE